MTRGTVTDDVDSWVFFAFEGFADLCYGISVWVEDGGFDAFFDAWDQGLALWDVGRDKGDLSNCM